MVAEAVRAQRRRSPSAGGLFYHTPTRSAVGRRYLGVDPDCTGHEIVEARLCFCGGGGRRVAVSVGFSLIIRLGGTGEIGFSGVRRNRRPRLLHRTQPGPRQLPHASQQQVPGFQFVCFTYDCHLDNLNLRQPW